MYVNEFVFRHIFGWKKRPDFSFIQNKTKNIAKQDPFALSLKRKQMLLSSDILLTLAGGENVKKMTRFRVTEQKGGAKSYKNQHIYFQ